MKTEIKCLPYLRLDGEQYIFIGDFKNPIRKGFLDRKKALLKKCLYSY